MGKKGSWLVAVKKAFSSESKEKKEKNGKSKSKWGFGKSKSGAPPASDSITVYSEESKFPDVTNEQNNQNHAYSVALATAVAAEAAVAAAQAAAEVVRLTTATRLAGKSKEEIAAIKIQTAFRGYLARRALRALRGLVRLRVLLDGNSVKRQATNTLRCMQTLARVQSQIRSRRVKMSEENQALQRQLQAKHEKELANMRMGEDWDHSLQSKEQLDAKLATKQEAAIRRERALAYAFTHQQQWRGSSKSGNPMFLDPNNPQWGWSWLERWMAARPWENRNAVDKDNSDAASVRTMSRSAGEIAKAYARRDEKQAPSALKSVKTATKRSPTTPPSKSASTTRKTHPSSPGSHNGQEEDSRSIFSMHSERNRRHSIAGSSIRDDESLGSSLPVPNYMTSTESAKAKARLSISPLSETPDKAAAAAAAASAKKRLSFSGADRNINGPPPAARRFSGPAKLDNPMREVNGTAEISVSGASLR